MLYDIIDAHVKSRSLDVGGCTVLEHINCAERRRSAQRAF